MDFCGGLGGGQTGDLNGADKRESYGSTVVYLQYANRHDIIITHRAIEANGNCIAGFEQIVWIRFDNGGLFRLSRATSHEHTAGEQKYCARRFHGMEDFTSGLFGFARGKLEGS